MKKVLALMLVLVTLICISSCGKKEGNVPYKLIISCEEVIEYMDDDTYGIVPEKKDIVPESGIILEIDAKCNEGDNVYDCAVNNLKENKLHFEGSDGYFTAIGNIYAGDCGDFSGWMFFVNGELAQLGASDTLINENDVVEFKYIVDYNTLFE